VMTVEPIHRAIAELKAQRSYGEVIYLCPDGQLLDQPLANELSLKGNLILLCGHYKGVDERVREHLITREVSIGDYVLSGGELAAAVVSDAVIRLLPGVLGDETSALSDSFQDGLVSPPDYTRPAEYQGWKVPDVLLSGHQANIDAWRHQQALERTRQRRPGLLGEPGVQDQ
ncbi:MAG TPA: tRNA (guanosine(37)-N1)-methyltransferase TrmD, partial [Flavobacteriales bacterium]|nr:tRNA (guanosine(37)-N1)-methyltransferase TrmD [Flavobacteriales bacterium]